MYQLDPARAATITERAEFHRAVATALIHDSSPDRQILRLVKVMHEYVVPRRLCQDGCAFMNVDLHALITIFEAAHAIVQKYVITHSWNSAETPPESVRAAIAGCISWRIERYPRHAVIPEQTAQNIRHNYPKCLNRLAGYAEEGCFALLAENLEVTWAQVAAANTGRCGPAMSFLNRL